MAADPDHALQVPPLPVPVLSLAITGHRASNPYYAANSEQIAATFAQILQAIVAVSPQSPVRLHSLLADGADQMAATAAVARGWELVAPLPFGQRLNCAINAQPATLDDVQRLLAGEPAQDPATAARAHAISLHYDQAKLFELADADAAVSALLLAARAAPGDVAAVQRLDNAVSRRVALAGRVMIEQADIMLAVWDGVTRDATGGTGHTLATALAAGLTVVLIDVRNPQAWHIIDSVEALGQPADLSDRDERLAMAVRGALQARGDAAAALAASAWRPRSQSMFHGYRRVEALFGGEGRPWRSLRSRYEPPQAIATGSGAPLLATIAALPGIDAAWPARMGTAVLARFAWADGIGARYSDLYRGGMVCNFLASLAAVLAGVAYLPFSVPESKWAFALAEFLLLSGIVVLTTLAHRGHWHDRWFETRRAAEYLRHAPLSLALGVVRPPGRWPRGAGPDWPEHHARQALRELGLPPGVITGAWLRMVLSGLLLPHLAGQRDYHRAKARRLHHVHHRLDAASEISFKLALLSVVLWLLLWAAGALGMTSPYLAEKAAKAFTFLGILFPSVGGMFAGIRYFGDFDRFAAISRVSAEKLDLLHRRVTLQLSLPDAGLDYGAVVDLAHATDDVVVSEIEGWQAVFAGKHFSVPV